MGWLNKPVIKNAILGILLGIGFVIPPLWPLGLLGVAGVLYLFIQTDISWLQAWFIFWIKSMLVSVWIWSVYPIDWLGFSIGWIELPVIALYWTTTAAALAFGGIGLLLLVRLLRRYSSVFGLYAAAPFLWLLAELGQSMVFSIFLYGPGGQIGVTYSMGYVGYLLAQHNIFIQLAGLAGVYSLGLFFVLVAVVLIPLFLKRRYVVVGVLFLILVLSSVWPIKSQPVAGSTISIVTIDTQTPAEAASDPAIMQVAIDKALEAAKAIESDYILLPEDSRYFDQSLDDKTLRALLTFRHSDTDAIIVDSGRTKYKDNFVLQAAIYDAQTNDLFQSQKRYLVPQGEFMPYGYSFMFQLIGQAQSSKKLQERLSYRVGSATSQAHFSDRIPAMLFCFEAVDPRGVQKALGERTGTVPFVAHIISHAWIHPSNIFRHQLENQLRVQAIWGDTYIVSVGNHVPGYTVTPTGAILYGETFASGQYYEAKVIEIPVRE